MANLLDAVPHLRVIDGTITHVSTAVWHELECEPGEFPTTLAELGTRLDDTTFEELFAGTAPLRLRLGPALEDRPIRLRRLDIDRDEADDSTDDDLDEGDLDDDDPDDGTGEVTLEVRSLAAQFRLESLLRRSGLGHMLLSPSVELEWSLSSNDITAVLPGDDPVSWIELMDADDMVTLGKAIYDVGADPTLRQTVSHRLFADRTYTIIDHVESALHDPDLRAVLVRSHFENRVSPSDPTALSPFEGVSVSDHMPIGVVLASDDGVVLHRNAVAAELVGAKVGQFLLPDGEEGPWMLSQLDAEQASLYRSMVAEALAGQPAHCTINSPTDPTVWLRVSASPAAASTVVLTIEDATELASAEAALRTSTRLLEALDSHSEDLVIVFDPQGRSRYVNPTARERGGAAAAVETFGDIIEMVDPGDREDVATLVERITSNTSSEAEVEFRWDRRRDDSRRWHLMVMTNLIDDHDVRGIVLTIRDVHERHLAESELRFKATHDALTTLPDRAALQTRLEALLQESSTDGGRTALMFCDIDNFKLINDRAGHRIGDLVLTEVADRLRSALRSSDFVGRFGGDEFVVVAPAVDDEAHAVELAERLFEAATGTVRAEDIDVDVSLSMGVAVTDEECRTTAALLNRADTAMYAAKQGGRGRVELYAQPVTDADDARLRNDLADAIDDGQLTLHYQPIVPLKKDLGRGYESLVRWEHPDVGVVSAQRLLDMAEVAGMGGPLDVELLRLASDDDRPWFQDPDGFIAVNVAASQLGAPDAAARLVSEMTDRGVDPSRLVIELTEAAFAEGHVVQHNLEVLRAAGIRVYLDDFGVGYSSLSQLRRFPVDGIKIDSSVVSPEVDEDLVELIVNVAATLDIRTVAEGVETEEQLRTVARLGVDYAQGYLLGRPARVPVAKLFDV